MDREGTELLLVLLGDISTGLLKGVLTSPTEPPMPTAPRLPPPRDEGEVVLETDVATFVIREFTLSDLGGV